MDPRLIWDHLAEAERHIALSDKHIVRQIEIINELERSGHSSELARDLLHPYRMVRNNHVAHCDLSRRELEQ